MKKLVSYITSSYPDKSFTEDLILSMKENGTDIVELGIPFSDPVADGEVIQQANLLSLRNGFKFDDVLEISKNIADKVDMYWMGYFNMFYHRDYDKIANEAKELNVKGFIIPDLPYEEAKSYTQIPLVDFVAPTDNEIRIKKILSNPKAFIYLVAYAGITGSNKNEDLTKIIENIRKVTNKEIYIGFGVNEKTAKEKSKNVDGVIVGSAFIKILLDNLTFKEKIDRISLLSREIKDKINS